MLDQRPDEGGQVEYPLPILSQQVEPSTGALLGNFPQAFSHLGLINAALRIDRAPRMRDEGIASPPYLLLHGHHR